MTSKNKHNAHVIMVTHSRKSDTEEKPTGKMDVKGTGAVTDLADNVFIIWRNKLRERAQQAAERGDEMTEQEKAAIDAPGAVLILDKQRNGEGFEGKFGLDFDQESNQYLSFTKGQRNFPFNYVAGECNHTYPQRHNEQYSSREI